MAMVLLMVAASCVMLSRGGDYREWDRLSDEVIVRRTSHGVPHIYADNMKAAGFALGWLQTEDYGSVVPEQLLRARGEWSRYNIIEEARLEAAINTDAASRITWQRAEETWPLLDPDTRDFLDGFAAGINLYIHRHPGELGDWVKPLFTGCDVHARTIVTPSAAVARSFVSARERQNKAMAEWTAPMPELQEEGAEDGSNAWAFGPGRTVPGRAILMRNPHLAWNAGYYEAHIMVPGKLNFYGDFRIGYGLGIIGGFNERLGFATTNNDPDLDDIYSFSIDPADSLRYILDGESYPVIRKKVVVEYITSRGIAMAEREFLSTAWGPVIMIGDGRVYIQRSGGDGEYRSGEQFLRMMKARNFTEWEAAMKMRAKVNSNLTYADADGNIFYVWNATIPDRPHDTTPDTVAIDVAGAAQMWQGIVPWEKMPMLLNPDGGYVRNENDTYHFTNLNEVLPPERFPSSFPDPVLRLRSQHSLQLVHGDGRFTLEQVVEMKHSMKMLLADRVKDDLIAAVEATGPEGETLSALRLIKEWDNSVAAGSRGGVLFNRWWDAYLASADTIRTAGTPASAGFAAAPEKLFRIPWSYDDPVNTPSGLADYDRAAAAFERAVATTANLYGRWDLAWGDVHRAVRGDVDVPVGGGSGLTGCFRVLSYTRHRSDPKRLEANSGDGWILAVEFGDVPRGYSVLAYGQSNKPGSPWHSDQIKDFAENRLTPVAYTHSDIMIDLKEEFRPGLKKGNR